LRGVRTEKSWRERTRKALQKKGGIQSRCKIGARKPWFQ
jgi:hypothetical protein